MPRVCSSAARSEPIHSDRLTTGQQTPCESPVARHTMNQRRYRAVVRASLLAPAMFVCSLWLIPASGAEASVLSPLPESDYSVRSVCAPPALAEAGYLALELVPETAAARAHNHPLGMTRS